MWTEEKDKILYRIQSDIYIARVILYDSAIYYNKWNMIVGWPPSIITGIVTILKSIEFASLISNPVYLMFTTYILIAIASIMGTVSMLLDYSGKSQKCKEMSDNLYELSENIKLMRSFAYDKRPESDRYLLDLNSKLVGYQKKMELVPYSVFHQYYPDDLKSLQFAFRLYDNPPIPIIV